MSLCRMPLPESPARMATYRRPATAIARSAFFAGVLCGAAVMTVLMLLESAL